jgi:hypothetical protein
VSLRVDSLETYAQALPEIVNPARLRLSTRRIFESPGQSTRAQLPWLEAGLSGA